MDPDKNIEPPVFEEDEEEVAHILRDLRYPDRLTQTAAKWLSSCLYQREYKRDSQRPPYQILKVVFSDILASLKVESSEFAEILQARFWDGYSVKEIIAGPKSSWSERSFFLQQKKAIRLFAFLLLEKEKACSQDAAKLSETAAEPKNTPVLLQETRESSWPAILFSLVGLIGLSAVLLHFIFPSFPKTNRNCFTKSNCNGNFACPSCYNNRTKYASTARIVGDEQVLPPRVARQHFVLHRNADRLLELALHLLVAVDGGVQRPVLRRNPA